MARWCRRRIAASCWRTWAPRWSRSSGRASAIARARAVRFPGDKPNPETSGLFLYLNTNKRGVTLDIAKPEGFEILEKLVAGADILIHNVTPPEMDRVGLTYDRMRRVESETDHDVDRCRSDSRAVSQLPRRGSDDLVRGRRVRAQRRRPGASGIAAAQDRRASGGLPGRSAWRDRDDVAAAFAQLSDGDGQHIEVSVQESIASILEMTFEYWPYMKMIATRLGQKPLQPVETMQCKDGYIYLCCIEEHQWRNFVEIMGNPGMGGRWRFSATGWSAR